MQQRNQLRSDSQSQICYFQQTYPTH